MHQGTEKLRRILVTDQARLKNLEDQKLTLSSELQSMNQKIEKSIRYVLQVLIGQVSSKKEKPHNRNI